MVDCKSIKMLHTNTETCDHQSGQHLFSAGCDNAARMYDLNTGQPQQVAGHDAPIKCVEYLDQNGGMLVTAGWDKKLKVSLSAVCSRSVS